MTNETLLTPSTQPQAVEEVNKNGTGVMIQLQKVTSFFGILKMYAVQGYQFFKDNKNNSKIMLLIAIVTCGIAIYFAFNLYLDISQLNGKTSELANLASYDTRVLDNNALTKPILKNADTIDDLLQENTLVEGEITKYTQYLSALQVPYTYLLQYIYLPSLNVWKQKYTNTIDTNLIGINFLENNPFNDITLLQTRGDFFKNLGDNNESNEIVDMQIGDFAEDMTGYFSMPITVSFTANSKRAFLLLVDKLSMTSNKENISLINEFFYYLRGELKKNKVEEIKSLEAEYTKIFGSQEAINQDKMIGYHIYNWIFNNTKNTLIDNTIIDKTIKSIVSCNNQPDEVCYYKFRERYRNLPTLGYLIGTDIGNNGAENLKKFVKQLPPMFSIQSFEFDTIKSPTLADATNNQYQGKVTIVVYGRSATAQEVTEIASVLGQKCLGEKQQLTPQDGVDIIERAIVKLSDVNKIDTSYGDELRELKGLVTQIDKDFATLSNYKKTIKLFELYRMLSDTGLCK